MKEVAKYLDRNNMTLRVSFSQKKGYRVTLTGRCGYTYVGQGPDLQAAWEDACNANFAGYLYRRSLDCWASGSIQGVACGLLGFDKDDFIAALNDVACSRAIKDQRRGGS